MSKINPDLTWYPPHFPKQGRLPTDTAATKRNCKQQDSHELAYRNELCHAAGKAVEPPCCKTLHISLFLTVQEITLITICIFPALNIQQILLVCFVQRSVRVMPVVFRGILKSWLI